MRNVILAMAGSSAVVLGIFASTPSYALMTQDQAAAESFVPAPSAPATTAPQGTPAQGEGVIAPGANPLSGQAEPGHGDSGQQPQP